MATGASDLIDMQSSAEFTDLYSKLHSHLSDNILERMASNLDPAGRGRPLKVPDLQPTNRVFLQLGLLKRQHDTVTWESLSAFAASHLCLAFGEGLPHLRSVIEQVQSEAAKTGLREVEEYLDRVRNFNFVKGQYCKLFGVTVDVLLGVSICHLSEPMKNGLVIELEQYRKLHSFKDAVFQGWLLKLCPQLNAFQLTNKQIRNKIDGLVRKHKDRQRHGKEHKALLEQEFCAYIVSATGTQSKTDSSIHTHRDSTSNPQAVAHPADSDTSVQQLQALQKECVTLTHDLKKARDENQKLHDQTLEIEKERETLKTQIKVLQSVSSSHWKELQHLKHKQEETKSDLEVKKQETEKLKEDLSAKSKACAAYARNANNIKRLQGNIASIKAQIKELSDQLEEAKKHFQSTKTQLFMQKRRCCQSENREAALKKKVSSLEEDLRKYVTGGERSDQSIQLKTSKGHYTPAVQACVIELMGFEIAANRVGPIIKSILSHLCPMKKFDLCDLPSKSTCLRFADIGHALSKLQISEELQSSLFDMHLDGTSRDHRKIVGHQVTLQDGKQMSLGFSTVDRETADSLINVTMNLLHEISFLGAATNDEADEILKDIFKHLIATMTDRAATMKSFGKKLDSVRKEMLSEEYGLEFLFCNAHFLLGLSHATSKALQTFEQEQGLSGNLGRDKNSIFMTFKRNCKDPAAYRLIRTACDVLGPRGDEKNGCQDDWAAYLSMENVKKKNYIGSFRSNRFNNLFESAAAIVSHKIDIVDFFSNFSEEKSLNLKQKSVLLDLRDDMIMLMVSALAVVYVCVSGPFWMLLNSDIHYLDMHKHIQTMTKHLEHFSEEGADLEQILSTLPSTLETFLLEETPVIQSVQEVALQFQKNTKFHRLLQLLSVEFLVVIKRQLEDFLPGGKYSQPPTEDQRMKMAHCKLTNLFGEANFGDLDFSIHKRRHGSIHHHSSVVMQKRNETSKWLTNKNEEEQHRLLDKARSAAGPLRKRHRENEEEEKRKGRERIQKKKEDKIQRDQAQQQQQMKIIQAVKKLGGLWITPQEIMQRVKSQQSLGAKKDALKQQFRYHKFVIGSKSSFLTMGKKTVKELTSSLCQYVESLDVGELEETAGHIRPPVAEERASPPSKRPYHGTVSKSIDTNTAPQNIADEMGQATISKPRTFNQQGEKVAVYYDDMYYVGEVLQIESESRATIAFMRGWRNKNAFKWPDSIETDSVDAKFVFVWNLNMFSTNGRTWFVQDFDELVKTYNDLKLA